MRATHPSEFLAGVRVLELGDGVAGASATAVLAQLGAEVTTVVDLGAPHRRGRPRATVDDTAQSLLSLLLDHGKRRIVAPPGAGRSWLEDLLQPDGERPRSLVVADRVGGPSNGVTDLGPADELRGWVESVNRGAWLTLSAFGLTGPRRDDTGTELTLNAACGMLSAIHDPTSGTPMKMAGQQVLVGAGHVAALAACHALELASGGTPVHLDLSVQEAGLATGPLLAVTHLLLGCQGPYGSRRYGAPAGFYPCIDGTIRITAMEDHQWDGVVRAVGSPEWTAPFNARIARTQRATELDAHLSAWTRQRTKAEVEAVLQGEGVPATATCAPTEILDSPQLRQRGTCRPVAIAPGLDVRTVAGPAIVAGAAAGAAPKRSGKARGVAGLRVTEISHVLAAPLAGSLLGALGAEVTKVEDRRRLDMYRRRGPYIDGHEGPNRTSYFTMVNFSKRSVAVDLERYDDVVVPMCAASDVVIENLGTRTAKLLGVDAETLSKRCPATLVVSSSGFGHTGPRAQFRAYAYNLHSSCGLSYLTRAPEGEPAQMDHAWADLVSGYAIATVVAAWAVGPTRRRTAGLDFAMADLVAARFNEHLAAASLGPWRDDAVDWGNDLAPCAPNGVYPTADGWVAISVDDDQTFEQLVNVLGDPPGAAGLAGAEVRWAQRRRLDDALAERTRREHAADLAERLRRQGVPAEAVALPADLVDDGHLASRGFFVPVEHPEWGRRRLAGLPWRVAGGPAIALAPPPLLPPSPDERPPIQSSATTAGAPGPS